MNRLTTFVILALAAALAGCGPVVIEGRPPAADGGMGEDASWSSDAPPSTDRAPTWDWSPVVDVPNACTSTADCEPGMECLGGEGCAIPWTCQPALGRPCTADYAPFCGCDGSTFYGSSTCPDRPFARRGACETDPPPVDGGPGPGCRLPDGRVCSVGEICTATECSVCVCGTAGELRCTGACVDAGPAPVYCRTDRDCTDGSQCSGPEGCGIPWTCQAPRPCTDDLAPFCGCDGVSFRGSSTCPGRPYAHRGACGIVPPDAGPGTCTIGGVTCRVGVPCRIDACTTCTCSSGPTSCSVVPGCSVDAGAVDAGGPPPFCAAQDARGVGFCAAFFGYAWDGTRCVGIGGCSCAGADCRGLPLDPMTCERNHADCPRPL